MELERDLVLRLPMVPYCVTYSAAERGRANGESRGFRVSSFLCSTNFLIILILVWAISMASCFVYGRCMTEVTRDRCNL